MLLIQIPMLEMKSELLINKNVSWWALPSAFSTRQTGSLRVCGIVQLLLALICLCGQAPGFPLRPRVFWLCDRGSGCWFTKSSINSFSHKKARGRRSCSYSSGRLLALGCEQNVLVPLLKPICTSIGQISLDFAVHLVTDSSLIVLLVFPLNGGW